jgi:CoA-dependent NAD(P)H sulfur oxidoreductase
MKSQEILVVGGVAAGTAAAAEAARTDPDANVTLYEQGAHISYGACEIPPLVAGDIQSAADLVNLRPREFEREKGAIVRTEHRVESIDTDRRRLFVRDLRADSAERVRFDKLILATGAIPRMPDAPGVDSENVFPIRTLSEADALRTFLDRNPVRHVVIVGGGYIGVEMAEAIVNRGIRATILEPQEGILNQYLSPPMRLIMQRAVEEAGVTVRKEFAERFDVGSDGRVVSVGTDRGEKIGCQAVLICMGVVPNTELAQSAGIRLGQSGAVATDDGMRTNIPTIWACGDVIEVRRVVDDRMIHLPLSPVGFRTARVAAYNAARGGKGSPRHFGGVTGASAVRVFGIEAGVAGLREWEATEAGIDCASVMITHSSRSGSHPDAEKLTVSLVAERGSRRLLGGELVGKDGAALRANILVPLLRERATIGDIQELELVYNPPVAPPRDALLIAASVLARELEKKNGRNRG